MRCLALAASLLLVSSFAAGQSRVPEKLRRSASPEAIAALSEASGEKPEVIRAIQMFRTQLESIRATREDELEFSREEVAEFHRKNPNFKPDNADQLLLVCFDWRPVAQQVSDIVPWILLLSSYGPCFEQGSASAYVVNRALVKVAIFKMRELAPSSWSTPWPGEKIDRVESYILGSNKKNIELLAELMRKEAVAAMSPAQKAAHEKSEQAQKAAGRANMCQFMKATVDQAIKAGDRASAENTLASMSLHGCK
ncbi:hypothetical protein [Variovorax sp. PBL-E5]|uniref:hypothetical protein n=2 Tax=Variovorax TaxID=34072 RepID=UPI00022A685C|nr:hypothetical protein [Variovorax sp. PBL-E5]AEO20120.1 hypothetical protein VASRS_45 [Variovorax sp. SRS16]VTU42682.1 hypothetical protein SRS16P1_00331 [Variovorax sp. SRS16]VTU42710.1 hypothetical protein E5P1_00329 [Variovorax sp. PBL-E5]VTU43839.1 hypothetical protein H6P1_00599 [Variovorax sp. PBL-H6]